MRDVMRSLKTTRNKSDKSQVRSKTKEETTTRSARASASPGRAPLGPVRSLCAPEDGQRVQRDWVAVPVVVSGGEGGGLK